MGTLRTPTTSFFSGSTSTSGTGITGNGGTDNPVRLVLSSTGNLEQVADGLAASATNVNTSGTSITGAGSTVDPIRLVLSSTGSLAQAADGLVANLTSSSGSLATVGYVNVVDDYNAVGDGVTDDTAAIQNAADTGRSVYFPGNRTYLVSGVISVTDQNNQKFFGDGPSSIIEQHHDTNNVFSIVGATGVEIAYLHGVGRTTTSGGFVALSSSSDQAFVFMRNCSNVNIHNCVAKGFPAYGVNGRNIRGFIISNNLFWQNDFSTPSGVSNADIQIDDNFDSDGEESFNGVISNNVCLSNAATANISAGFHPTSRIVVSNNICSTVDSEMNDLAEGSIVKRHCIVISYNQDDFRSDKIGELICSNNVCHNSIWTGIYINGEGSIVDNEGGYYVVNGNICTNNGLNVAGGDTSLQGGINCIHAKDITISNNIVRSFRTSTGAAIQIRAQSSGTRLVCNGNVIDGSEGDGIKLWTEGEQAMVANNTIHDCSGTSLNAFSSTAPFGQYSILGNRIIHRANNTRPCTLNIGSSISGAQDIIFQGNYVHATELPTGSTELVWVANPRINFANNILAGRAGSTSSIGLRFGSAAQGSAIEFCSVTNNHFRDLSQGVAQTTATGNQGPIVITNNKFENVTQKIGNSSSSVYFGTVNGDNTQLYADLPPSGIGVWSVGDIAWNTDAATAGNPVYWVCTVGGDPPTTWTAGYGI
jgi:hypothetical protein